MGVEGRRRYRDIEAEGEVVDGEVSRCRDVGMSGCRDVEGRNTQEEEEM